MASGTRTKVTAYLVLLALLLAAAVVATRLEVNTDMGAFLPRGEGAEQAVLLDQLNSGASARVLLVAIDGEEAAELAQLSGELATVLREDGRFEQVLNGELDLAQLHDSPWYRYRYLLQQERLDAPSLTRALEARLEELRTPLGLYVRQSLPEDPTAAMRRLMQQWQGAGRPQRRHGIWFGADGRALLLLRTHAPGFALDAQEENLRRVRKAFAGLADSGSAALSISGAPAIAVASRETIRSEAQQASLVASLAVALILLVAYRSWRLWLLSALPLGGAIVVALATTTTLFGAVHGITIAFGITLLGVAIDYPIHLFSHLRPGQAPGESLRRIWPTLRLGVVSTAIGFSALLFTRFDGLVQLGVFAVSGLLSAALVTRFLLPALLPEYWSGSGYGRQAPISAAARGRSWAAPLLLVLSLLYLGTSGQPLWEESLEALSPVPTAMREQEGKLREALAVSGMNRLLLMRAQDPQALLQAQERLEPQLRQWREAGLIEGAEYAAERLPSIARQRERQTALPEEEALRVALAEATAATPFRSEALEPFVAAVATSRELPPLTLERLQGTALGLSLESLMFEHDGHWWGVIRLVGLSEAEALQQRLDPGLSYVDLKALTRDLLRGFREDALRNLIWGGLAILLLIAWGAGGVRRTLHVVLPLAAAIALTLALLHALGERYTLFHLTALLLVAGIGIDYGLFFSRPEGRAAAARTRHALGVCAISTVTVFAILSISRLPVLHAIGTTVLLGVASAYLLARFGGGVPPAAAHRKDDVAEE
ncbi:MAG: MMPL family transporter [Pseudomonadota bacterium]